MTKATIEAEDLANQDLVVAHVGVVEEDLLELDAPVDNALGGDEGNVGAGNEEPAGEGEPDEAGDAAESGGSDIDVSDASSILSDEASSSSEMSLPSTSEEDTTEDDDNDSIVSTDNEPRRIVTVTVPANASTREVTNAIVGDDQSAEADANAVPEGAAVENRLNESIPWEQYVVPDNGDGDDGGDDGDDGDGDDGDDDLDLGPVDRARLLFRRDLEIRLEAYRTTGVADSLMVQMLTHG